MATTVIRAYDDLVNAESARNDLIMYGFPPTSVHLSSLIDEAGPVEGNFVLDDKDTGKGPGRTALRPEARTDAYNDDKAIWRSAYVLSVEAEDEDQSVKASDIMDRYHAINLDRRNAHLH